MELKDLLNKEICEDLEGLMELNLGSDEHRAGVDAVTKLIDREIELRKLEIERQEKVIERQERIETRKTDDELKLKQMKENKVDRFIGYAINVAGIVIPVAVTVWGTKVSLKFEEEGTITTVAGRNFFSRLFSKK